MKRTGRLLAVGSAAGSRRIATTVVTTSTRRYARRRRAMAVQEGGRAVETGWGGRREKRARCAGKRNRTALGNGVLKKVRSLAVRPRRKFASGQAKEKRWGTL